MIKRQRKAMLFGFRLLILFALFPYFGRRNAFDFIGRNDSSGIDCGITSSVLGIIVLGTGVAVVLLGGNGGMPKGDEWHADHRGAATMRSPG